MESLILQKEDATLKVIHQPFLEKSNKSLGHIWTRFVKALFLLSKPNLSRDTCTQYTILNGNKSKWQMHHSAASSIDQWINQESRQRWWLHFRSSSIECPIMADLSYSSALLFLLWQTQSVHVPLVAVVYSTKLDEAQPKTLKKQSPTRSCTLRTRSLEQLRKCIE